MFLKSFTISKVILNCNRLQYFKNVKITNYLFNTIQFLLQIELKIHLSLKPWNEFLNRFVIKLNSVEKVVGYFNILIESFAENVN
jgi:hypothetical protein